MAVKFKNREARLHLTVGKDDDLFEQIPLFDEDGEPTGKTIAKAIKPTTSSYEERPEEVARRKARHDKNRAKDYVKKRVREYPNFGELAEMMFEIVEDKILLGEALLPLEDAWYSRCKAVREKYPKPPQQEFLWPQVHRLIKNS